MQSRLDLIRKGQKTKSVTGVNEKKNAIFHKTGSKYIVTEKEKKVEEAGVTRKKRNYVMFESKIGTEIEKDKMKIAASKPKPEIRPRVEEKIISQRRHKEYLDNYQYYESKDIKRNDPSKTSIVIHKRLGDVVGGSYDEMTYEKKINSIPYQIYQNKTTNIRKGGDIVKQKQTTTITRNQRAISHERKLPDVQKDIKLNKRTSSYRAIPKSNETTKTTTVRRVTKTVVSNTGGRRAPIPNRKY